MKEQELKQLTRQWILIWNDRDPRTLPLTDDFEHFSPYGHIAGKKRYLDTVVPLVKENVARLTIGDVMVSGDRSAIRYTNALAKPAGATIHACDWLTFKDGEIASVHSYYERPNRESSL